MRLKQEVDQKPAEIDQQKCVVFYHDNSRTHTSLATQKILREFGWEVLIHPPYSPDLAPSDFHLFRSLQNSLENTFTVVVEKDGRGLGMSVCGGGGLVRIRRLYPPQPAWRTGQLAQRDILLAANGAPLAGLSTYEALEVLRTAAPRVELRVCRPPPDLAESMTPPEPPTPPARTPHPPAPLDPLNCHPMHARKGLDLKPSLYIGPLRVAMGTVNNHRHCCSGSFRLPYVHSKTRNVNGQFAQGQNRIRLSQTTSSATTSSSEGRGRRDASPESERRELRLPDLEQPLPVYDVQYGEFDIVMTKVNGSLGFTLRKEDHSALGHYVRALVREPALSDGRIQPGDRIVAVNDTPMSNMSHSEAVAFLRACEPEVRLRLYRDHAATPLSPTSPRDDGHTDSDGPMRPKPPLRPEAVSMLCDLAARRLTPDAGDAPRSPCLSPRKFRKLTKDNHYEQQDGPYTVECVPGARPETERRAPVAHGSPPPSASRKQKLSLTGETLSASGTLPTASESTPRCIHVASHGYELNNLNNEALDAPSVYQEDNKRYGATFPESDEPVSMPVDLSSDEARFAHTNPAYQSAVLITDTASSGEGHKDDGNGLKKWKGVTLSPDNERKPMLETKPKEDHAVQKEKENVKPESPNQETSKEPTIVTVELNRGWNSRLGFSVQSHPDSGQSYISAVYNDSVAARDGRLRKGDVILQVNDENVTSMKTPEVIDLLRILRGSICITVLRPPNPQ
ncbi:Tyrosine-protein phosphatase non-receptor type 13 [Eumeta japonica]|uniref:Tyrosine-protein phosphatase non-receptor type 13 n=1 Tax=Eumeta variegata TaxID=151549 RepID=A0A4C1VE18_EUMVA|nr:Tyrosine-protein phosphatase non-receptor type 13 [Eumeta japonica]